VVRAPNKSCPVSRGRLCAVDRKSHEREDDTNDQAAWAMSAQTASPRNVSWLFFLQKKKKKKFFSPTKTKIQSVFFFPIFFRKKVGHGLADAF
jgi:hypothetical protein